MKLKIIVILFSFFFLSAFIDHGNSSSILKIDAEKIYKSNCRICHGSKGKLGINGATNLRTSTLDQDGIIEVITHGRGVMTPFKNILDAKEIKALAKYVDKMKK